MSLKIMRDGLKCTIVCVVNENTMDCMRSNMPDIFEIQLEKTGEKYILIALND